MPDWSPVDLLPGVWFGLLALLLHRTLKRWYDPVPAWVLGAFVLVLLPLFGPVLGGGKILLPLDGLRGEAPFRGLMPADPPGNPIQGDLLQLVTPSLAAVREAYGEGRWPLWNPRVGAGMPLLADPQAQAAAPLVLLATPLPLWRAAGVTAALRVWMALVFGFLLLRRQGLHPGPALAGAFGFGLGGFLLLWLGWPLANTAALLPLFLYSLVRCDQEGGRRDRLLLALATFSLLLAGHPETIVYALALGLAFLLDLVRRRPAGRRRALLLGTGLAMALAAAAAAPLLVPTLRYLPQTLRAAHLRDRAPRPLVSDEPGDTEGDARDTGLAARLLPLAAPNAYGNSRFFSYWGRANTNEDASGFAGTAILLLVLLGVLGVGSGDAGRRFPQERVMLGVAGLALLLLALGPGPAPLRLTLLVNVAFAYVGACTLERWRAGEVPPNRRPVLLTLSVAAVLAVVLAWAYLAHPDPSDPGRLAVLRFGWLRWQLRFLVATALLLVAGWRQRWMPPLVAVVLACELLLAHQPANPASPGRLLFPLNDPLRFLADHLGQDRMAALGSAFPPNLASLYGLSDARVYNPMAPQRYALRTAPITVRFRGEVPEWGNPADPLYAQLGVRYLLIEPGGDCPAPLTTALRDPAALVCAVADPLPRLSVPGGTAFDLQIPDADHLGARVPATPGAGPAGRRLVSSLYQDGGWRLLADGRRIAAAEVSGPFVTAPLPAGAVSIDLLYRPPGFLRGCLLAALALALGTAAWCPPPRKPVE
jgi:hypothetical protein